MAQNGFGDKESRAISVACFWRPLRRPAGRVYFAGEHADAYTSYMEGAVRSGRRVAAAIERRG